MRKFSRRASAFLLALPFCIAPAGAESAVAPNSPASAQCGSEQGSGTLMGAWTTKATGAPFVAHVWLFHADGTMLMSGPPAGNPKTSLSNGVGLWRKTENQTYSARFVEVGADRATAAFTGTVIVDLTIAVSCSAFTAVAETNYYKPGGEHAEGPFEARLEGTRIALRQGTP